MADQKISQLSAAAALTGTELVPIVQSSSTVSTTPAAIKTYTNSAIPNSALAQINASTTDTTVGNISRNGDWGVGATAVDIPDFTVANANYSRFGRALAGATGGSGVAMSVIAAPYDGTPTTNYFGVTGGGTGAARLWAGTKSGAAATPTWTEFARLTSPTFTSNIGLGGISSTYLLSIAGSLTGGTTTGGINVSSTIQSGVTTTAYGALIGPTTAATAFTLGTFTGVQVGVSLGAGSTVTNAYGYRATSLLSTNATNAFGFYSEIAAGSGSKFNFYAAGTAQNYLGGPLGLGAITQTGWTFRNLLSITGATTAYQNTSGGVIQSDVTSTAIYNETNANTVAAAFTLPSIIHYRATQGTIGAGSAVTSQNAFVADASLIGASFNIGFRGQIPSGTSRYNMYMDGTAANYINGFTGFGTLNPLVSVQIGGNDYREFRMFRADATGNAQAMVFAKARGTETAQTIVSNGDTLGTILWNGNDGSGSTVGAVKVGAQIDVKVEGTPGTGAIPSRMMFYTANSSGTLIERMRISTAGVTSFAGLISETTANTLTAVGTTLGTALALTAAYNVVTSAAAGTGVALPNVVGAQVWVFNNQGTNAINVYPPTGTLNGAASVSLAANAKMMYIQIAAGVWYTMS